MAQEINLDLSLIWGLRNMWSQFSISRYSSLYRATEWWKENEGWTAAKQYKAKPIPYLHMAGSSLKKKGQWAEIHGKFS